MRASHVATQATASFQVGAENATMLAPAPGDHPMPPRSPIAATMLAPNGSSDPISQVSNATLGAAAVAYPQHSLTPSPLAKKSNAPALIGGLLLVGLLFGGGAFAYKRPDLRARILHTGSPATAQQGNVAATPNNAITSETPVIPAPIDSTPPNAVASAIPSAVESAAPIASASAAPVASASIAAKTTPPASTKSSSHDSSAHESNHTTAKPATKPASGSHSTDYGF